jgi:hypothetical protein
VKTFQAVYYRAEDGSEPVRDFLVGLDLKSRAALLRQIDRLNDESGGLGARSGARRKRKRRKR